MSTHPASDSGAIPGTPRVEYGGLAALPRLVSGVRRSGVLVVTGEGKRYVERLGDALPGVQLTVFRGARRHVPEEVVERAREALDACAAGTVVSVGGGSATGLGKALRLERDFFFIAVPTTYAASELTDLYGVTTQGAKRTGRDPRVIPDVALYDVELTLDMPLRLSVTSLLNALAHPLGALSTQSLDEAAEEAALEAASTVYRAVTALTRQPRDVAARAEALRGTVLSGRVLRNCPVGVHHRVAHALGGRFDLDHASLHALLLPHSLLWLQAQAPDVAEKIRARLALDLPARIEAFLSLAATSLHELGVTPGDLREFLEGRPDLPRSLVEAAYGSVLR